MIKAEKIKQYIRIGWRFMKETAKTLVLMPLARLIYRKKTIWLVSERGTEAQDNGYHFFRYLCEKHPEIECFYVISKDSPDRERVASLGKVVDYKSLRHYLLFFGAKYLISTHIMGFAPNRDFFLHIQNKAKRNIMKSKTVFLRHGVSKDDIAMYRNFVFVDLVICGAKPEYDYFAKNWDGMDSKVRYTGLARFDALHEFEVERQILIMPTWRRWLAYGDNTSDNEILESSYFQHWSSLLQNTRLAEMAKKYKIQFVFYPHHEIQKYIGKFPAASSDIVIADSHHYDVQQLLKSSMLLITDYSSVYFDFAYMQKPVLYYQFDEEEFRAHHYAQGYFDYRRDGFGEVVTDEEKLLGLLEEYLMDDCHMKPEYQRRIEGFFPLHDDKNCERTYHEIIEL